MKKVKLIFITLALTISMTSQVGAASPSPSATNPYGGVKVDPLGPNETILVLSKAGKIRKLSFNNLLALKPTQISIYEPFVHARQKFTVVKLSTLFKLVGISANDRVSTVALNDYVYANKAGSFLDADGYLAIKRNGELIPYDQGGPIRIIFPDKSKWSKVLDPWNWSLTRITAK